MAHQRGRDCRVPGNFSGSSWTCPRCGNVWSRTPTERVTPIPWFGKRREHIRNADGSKLSWWQ